MDPHQSTDAACRYLKGLYNTWQMGFGYCSFNNCGPGNVRKAIRREWLQRFLEIYRICQENCSYIPQFIAINYLLNLPKNIIFSPIKNYHWHYQIPSLSTKFAPGYIRTFCRYCFGGIT